MNAIHRLCPNILFCNRVHNPLKLFASTLSAFSCSLSCENTVSTLRRKRKISLHTCIQKDDIQEIVMCLQKCQTVLIAAPVYWANVPAPVKNLFDRLLGTAMEETSTFPKPRLKGKKYMLLTSCNTPFPFSWIFGQSRGAIHTMDEFFKTAGMKPIGKIVCAGTASKKELPKQTIKKIERCMK